MGNFARVIQIWRPIRIFSTVPYPCIEGVYGQDKIEYLSKSPSRFKLKVAQKMGGRMIVRLCTLTPSTREGVELCYTFFTPKGQTLCVVTMEIDTVI